MRSQPNPLAGLAFLHIAGLAVVRAPESTPYPTCAMGCSPALGDRPAEQVRAPSLAGIADKGARTDCMGCAHPTGELGPAWTLSQGVRAWGLQGSRARAVGVGLRRF